MSSFVDASVIVCHLTGEPIEHRDEARRVFDGTAPCFVSAVTIADAVNVLEVAYDTERSLIATAMRSLLACDSVVCVDPAVLLRALGIYEIDAVRFPTAYSVALAESTGVNAVASFDTSIDRVRTVERVHRSGANPA